MPSYTIEAVAEDTREWQSKQGDTFVSYNVNIAGGDFVGEAAEISRKPESPAPYVGEVLSDYELLPKKGTFPRKLKRMKQGGGFGGGGKASSGDFRTPQQIMRSDAHGKAMHWCDIKVAAGEWKPLTWEQYIAMVDRYYDDIKSAV